MAVGRCRPTRLRPLKGSSPSSRSRRPTAARSRCARTGPCSPGVSNGGNGRLGTTPSSFFETRGSWGPDSHLPTPLAVTFDAVDVLSHNSHTLALTRDGRVYAWGSGDKGQLGIGPMPVILRRRNLEDQVTAYRSLMPYEIEKATKLGEIRSRQQAQHDNALLQRALLLQGMKQEMDPERIARGQLTDVLSPKTVNVPWNADLGSEGDVPTTGSPTPLPINRGRAASLAVQAGVSGSDLEKLIGLSEGVVKEPELKPSDIYIDRDPYEGTLQRVRRTTGEVFPVAGATNTPRPPFAWNENTIAGVLSGAIPLPAGVSMPQVEDMRTNLINIRGESTKKRVGGGIEAQGEHQDTLARLQAAKARATKQVGLDYLPRTSSRFPSKEKRPYGIFKPYAKRATNQRQGCKI